MKTVPDLIMNPCHFQMRHLRKIPSEGWLARRQRSPATADAQPDGWGVASKQPPTPGPDGPFPSRRGFGCHFLSHIEQLSGVAALKGHAIGLQDRVKVVSHKTQGLGCLSFVNPLRTTPGRAAFIQPI